MSSTSRAWIVAASMSAVEAMKDQGFSRWNYTFRSLHQHAKSRTGSSISQTQRLSMSGAVASRLRSNGDEKAKQSEESLRKVIYLSCWGPN